jgi:hypothetical protein
LYRLGLVVQLLLPYRISGVGALGHLYIWGVAQVGSWNEAIMRCAVRRRKRTGICSTKANQLTPKGVKSKLLLPCNRTVTFIDWLWAFVLGELKLADSESSFAEV